MNPIGLKWFAHACLALTQTLYFVFTPTENALAKKATVTKYCRVQVVDGGLCQSFFMWFDLIFLQTHLLQLFYVTVRENIPLITRSVLTLKSPPSIHCSSVKDYLGFLTSKSHPPRMTLSFLLPNLSKVPSLRPSPTASVFRSTVARSITLSKTDFQIVPPVKSHESFWN